MPIRVEAVCVSTPETRVAKLPREEVHVGRYGIEGDRHAGETRLHPRTGQEITNRRQWSAVSTGEVEAFCRELGVMAFEAGELGENIRLSGIDLGDVKPGTVFEFPSGCRLQVSAQNDPCENAAGELAVRYGPEVGRYFVRASFGHRGVVGAVLTPGTIRPGDEVRVVTPEDVTASAAREGARQP
jgi:MOSC domain-containing protein YiiM